MFNFLLFVLVSFFAFFLLVDDIPFAPTSGWSPTKDAVATVGHTYVIWTWDNHFAKIRISQITNERVVFDWAYQLVEGERQLKPSATLGEREPLEKNLRR